ncbi:MAG: PilZ domain-containing protein [Nitrospirae bacterium]|nr:PilZ domain-containing protein [Candidatus Manganitrophaceae bacterium]
MHEDKRDGLRVPFAPIAIITRVNKNVSHAVRVRDLSIKGIGIYSNDVFQKDEQLLVELALPGEQDAEILMIPGEVAWLETLQGVTQYLIGIKFHLIPEFKEKLQSYIHSIEERLNYKELK